MRDRYPYSVVALSLSHALLAAALLGCAGAITAASDPTAASGPAPLYFVATTGSNASGDGSGTSPWATIEYALGQVPDGAEIRVRPGTYNGRVRIDEDFAQGVVVKSEVPYLAQLRHNGTVVTCYYGRGITLEGFDIAHAGPGSAPLVIQIQDLIGAPGGTETVSRIVLRNNIIHDSYDNDLLKINNGATDVLVTGNLFYNQAGSDEHIDVNSVLRVTVEDNIFMNDFAGSGRTNGNDTSAYIVIKDSNADSDGNLGCHDIAVRRNVFLNWEGSTGSNFVLIGEDGQPYYEAEDVLVENNLMLGNSANVMRASVGVKGGKDITFRHNTITGDLPSLAYAMRLNQEGANLPCNNIRFYNNIWTDPSGTMGAENASRPNDFSDTPIGETASFTLSHNFSWNGFAAIPTDNAEQVNYDDDAYAFVADPQLPSQAGLVLPRWVPATSKFADGSTSIRAAFVRLVTRYGVPGEAVRDRADGSQSPSTDILGRVRIYGNGPDCGAYELPLYRKNPGPSPRVSPQSP